MIKLRLESVMSMESSGHQLSLVTLINDKEDRQLTFVCDRYVRDQFVTRDTAKTKIDTIRLLPEVLIEILRNNRTMELKNLRIIIYGVYEGEYETELEDLNSSLTYPIRLSDAVLLSSISKIPIYVLSSILDRQGTPYSKQDMYTKSMPINILPEDNLREALQNAINNEDYQLAKVLSDEYIKTDKKFAHDYELLLKTFQKFL